MIVACMLPAPTCDLRAVRFYESVVLWKTRACRECRSMNLWAQRLCFFWQVFPLKFLRHLRSTLCLRWNFREWSHGSVCQPCFACRDAFLFEDSTPLWKSRFRLDGLAGNDWLRCMLLYRGSFSLEHCLHERKGPKCSTVRMLRIRCLFGDPAKPIVATRDRARQPHALLQALAWRLCMRTKAQGSFSSWRKIRVELWGLGWNLEAGEWPEAREVGSMWHYLSEREVRALAKFRFHLWPEQPWNPCLQLREPVHTVARSFSLHLLELWRRPLLPIGVCDLPWAVCCAGTCLRCPDRLGRSLPASSPRSPAPPWPPGAAGRCRPPSPRPRDPPTRRRPGPPCPLGLSWAFEWPYRWLLLHFYRSDPSAGAPRPPAGPPRALETRFPDPSSPRSLPPAAPGRGWSSLLPGSPSLLACRAGPWWPPPSWTHPWPARICFGLPCSARNRLGPPRAGRSAPPPRSSPGSSAWVPAPAWQRRPAGPQWPALRSGPVGPETPAGRSGIAV